MSTSGVRRLRVAAGLTLLAAAAAIAPLCRAEDGPPRERFTSGRATVPAPPAPAPPAVTLVRDPFDAGVPAHGPGAGDAQFVLAIAQSRGTAAAILAVGSGTRLVRVGDRLGDARVTAIAADAVHLSDGTLLRIAGGTP